MKMLLKDAARYIGLAFLLILAAVGGLAIYDWSSAPTWKQIQRAERPCQCRCECQIPAPQAPDTVSYHIEQKEAVNYLVPPATEPDELARCRKKK